MLRVLVATLALYLALTLAGSSVVGWQATAGAYSVVWYHPLDALAPVPRGTLDRPAPR